MGSLPEHVLRGANAAHELRLAEGVGLEPIPELWDFIRGLGVDLAFHNFGDDGADGVYYWDGDRGLIVINSGRQPLARQRFTAAHELGHHVLHREDGTALEVVDQDIFAKANEAVEKEANAFAARLLAPEAAMRAAFPGKPDAELSPEDVADLMHEFGTTFQTTVYQLHNSGRIAAATRDRLLDEAYGQVNWILRVKGYDEEEVRRGSDLPPEYVLRVLEMCRAGAIEVDRAAELLRTSPADVEDLLGPVAERDAAVDDALRATFGEDLDALLSEAGAELS